MIDAPTLTTLFGYNYELVIRQTEGLSQAQSLLAPSFGGNCVNWLVGHLISSRMRALLLLGEPLLWDDARRRPYRSGAPPLDPADPGCLPLAELRAAFASSQERLLGGLSRVPAGRLSQPSGYQQLTVGDSLAYIHFHEAQHVGQILALAPLMGAASVWLTE
jgi:hypothetical protein